MKHLKNIYNKFHRLYYNSSPQRYEAFLRKKGISIGDNIFWGKPRTIIIDTSRPCLIKIGNNVKINTGTTIWTHDFTTYVFRLVYHDFVSSTAKVTIGNNVYLGRDCTVLKGVTIGDNCIIGTGSIVTKDIPPNSFAAGVPAKVVSSLEDFYNKRKKASVEEAKAYAREIQRHYGRRPVMEDFKEEFPLFWHPGMKTSKEFKDLVRFQLGPAYDEFVKTHTPFYDSFEAFLEDCDLDSNQ